MADLTPERARKIGRRYKAAKAGYSDKISVSARESARPEPVSNKKDFNG